MGKPGDRRNVPQFFDEWKLVNVPSVPSFSPVFVPSVSGLAPERFNATQIKPAAFNRGRKVTILEHR